MSYFYPRIYGVNQNQIGVFRTTGNIQNNYRYSKNKISEPKSEKKQNNNDTAGIIGKGLAIAGALILTYKGHNVISNAINSVKSKTGSFRSCHKNLSFKGFCNCIESIGSSLWNVVKSVGKVLPDTGKAVFNVFKKTSK